ncbi:MAG: mechanosensitive ion channel family protein [Cyclobacteriaceae bacterium]|nr:mechanosensitive ion channel family protein [Cyclobacteriaceae bacterium]
MKMIKFLFRKGTLQIALVSFLVVSGIEATAFQEELSSPRASVKYLKKYTSADSADYGMASKLISGKDIFLARKRRQYIQDIREALDASRFRWILDSISDNPNYKAADGSSTYVIVADISLARQGDQWLISKQTINNLPDLLKGLGVISENENNQNEDDGSKGVFGKKNETSSTSASKPKTKDLPEVKLDLSNPRSLVIGFTKYTSKEDWRPDVAQQVIYYKFLPHKEERIERIEQLKRFLDGKGVLINVADVPNDPDYVDTLHMNAHEYVITPRFAELYLQKIGDQWYLSEETTKKIPELFERAFPFGSDRLLQYLPSDQTKYLGLMLWQYLAILSLVIFGFLFNKVLSWGTHYVITRILFRVGKKKVATSYIRPVVRPLSLLVVLAIVNMFLPILQLPLEVSHYLGLAISASLPFFGTLAAYKVVDIVALYFEKLALKTESTLDDQLVPLFRKIAKTFVIVIGAVFVLANLNIKLVPLLATLSIGGLAFALAAQDTIKNFFGSLMIFVDKPFQVGQWISAEGIDGTVEEVGLRSTRIRTFSNSLIYVPNGKLADATIDNHGLRAYRRFSTQLAVTYDTPPELIEVFVEGLRRIVLEHPNTWKDNFNIYLNDLNSHSLDIKFYIFFELPTWAEELKARHEIIMSILKLAHTLGVNFAFPTQTLHIQDLPGQLSLAPTYPKVVNARKEMEKFFEKEAPKQPDSNKV